MHSPAPTTNPALTPRVLDLKDAAVVLRCSVYTLYRTIKAGRLRVVRLGAKGGYRVPVDAIDEFLTGA